MVVIEIENHLKKSIDQWFQSPNKKYIRENSMMYIAGILNVALRLLPLNRYYGLIEYIKSNYNYDPNDYSDSKRKEIKIMKKKQYNFYMSSSVKDMIDLIRRKDPNQIYSLSDSQIVEYVIRQYYDMFADDESE